MLGTVPDTGEADIVSAVTLRCFSAIEHQSTQWKKNKVFHIGVWGAMIFTVEKWSFSENMMSELALEMLIGKPFRVLWLVSLSSPPFANPGEIVFNKLIHHGSRWAEGDVWN